MSNKRRTYLDSGVLFAAHRGEPAERLRALTVLNHDAREFVTSDFLALELIPKAVYFKNIKEREFYEDYFDRAVSRIKSSVELVNAAYTQACALGLQAMDALHLACALAAGTVEFITTEKPTKPIYRTKDIQVTTL